MPNSYAASEDEMTIYAYKGPAHVPKFLNDFVERVLPSEWAEKLTGRTMLSWAKLYNAFIEEGLPQTHTKRGVKYDGVWFKEGKYYGDGYERMSMGLGKVKEDSNHYPEFCTFPTRIRKGFAKEAADATIAQRAKALKALGEGGRVDVLNTHYNLSIDISEDQFYELSSTLAPAYALMLFSDDRRFARFAKRNSDKKGGCIEIAVAALMDPEQLEAAYAFLAGTLNGMARRGSPPATRMMIKEKPIDETWLNADEYSNCSKFESGKDYELPIIKNGPDAVLKTTQGKMTARQYFGLCLDFYRHDIEEVATEAEMKILDGLADGSRRFEIEKKPSHTVDEAGLLQTTGGTSLDGILADYKPTHEASLFSDAGANWWYKKIGNGAYRTTKSIDWSGPVLEFSVGKMTKTIEVPLERMDEYLKLEEELRSEKASLRKLVEWSGR